MWREFEGLVRTLARVAELPDGEMAHLRAHAKPGRHHAGETLLEVGEPPTNCWFLADGFLRFFYLTESGREYNKAFSRPGEIVVPLSGMLGDRPSDYAIAAITDVVTVTLPARLVPELYDRDPAWERVGRVLAERMALRKEERERELLLDSALTRYERFAERYPELVDVVPQRQIANYIGVTEQALSRLLREFG